jgi:ribA/ribD-fused uncharacterized protein
MSPDLIDYFDAPPYEWLSNFYPCQIIWQGAVWSTVEHAFQAAKTHDAAYRDMIRTTATPGHAKMLGQRSAFAHHHVELRPDWETVKYDVMIDLLRLKFREPDLRRMLLSTGNAKLVEGNTWNDTCWGVCNGVGANNLGRSLMLVRAELKADLL